ncbi:MAG: S4 domain-containing protein [Erythrobacter sp.]|uniref:S4 domain-containing protein n=1 Tax=Erythrobacter sp. TaxID=1042 RepID=UPI003262E934
MGEGDNTKQGLRLDRLLVYLRFARTRSAARSMIEGRSLRRNRKHVRRSSEMIAIGDVLTLAVGGEVRVIEILALPKRRASPASARTFYLEYDRGTQQ